jgi:hypothetical protein
LCCVARSRLEAVIYGVQERVRGYRRGAPHSLNARRRTAGCERWGHYRPAVRCSSTLAPLMGDPPFEQEAQAGYGIGSRVMRSIFLPAMAISFAAAPIAGQNFGARHAPRVRETFRQTALISAGVVSFALLARQMRMKLGKPDVAAAV